MSKTYQGKVTQKPDINREHSSQNIKNAKRRIASLLSIVSRMKPVNNQTRPRRKSIRPQTHGAQSQNSSITSRSPNQPSHTPKQSMSHSTFSYIELLNSMKDYKVPLLNRFFPLDALEAA